MHLRIACIWDGIGDGWRDGCFSLIRNNLQLFSFMNFYIYFIMEICEQTNKGHGDTNYVISLIFVVTRIFPYMACH